MFVTNVPHLSSKQILRGAVTNGYEWVFVIFYLDKDGIGGTYKASPPIRINVGNNYPYHVHSPEPNIVAGIVAYWVCFTHFSFMCSHEKMSDGTQLC